MFHCIERKKIMSSQTENIEKPTMSNTKKEILEAYDRLLKENRAKAQAQVQPEKKIEEKSRKEALDVADAFSTENVVRDILNLKMEMGKTLTGLSEKLEEAVNSYTKVQKAVSIRQDELKEIYEIEKEAETLASLIDAQHEKRISFEQEMADKKAALNEEIEKQRAEWAREQKLHDKVEQESEEMEKKRRKREKDEYEYAFKREQQLAKDAFDDEKARNAKEIENRKREMEKDLAEREAAVSASEEELAMLREQAQGIQGRIEQAVNAAVKETAEKMKQEAKNAQDMLKKEFDGERNVLNARIENYEKTVKEQGEQILRLAQQAEDAYRKVQDIAVKAIEGSSSAGAFSGLQNLISEQSSRKPLEK